MIIDDIADVLEQEKETMGIAELSKRTGICRSKLYNIMYGCGYVFNADFIAALDALGYTLELKKKGGDSLDSGTQDPE